MRKRPTREKVVQSLVDPQTFAKLVKAADAQDVSVSSYVRRLIEGAVAHAPANSVGIRSNKVAA